MRRSALGQSAARWIRDRWFFISILALTGLALVLRLYHLDTFPLGLFWDEAFEGLDAASLFGKPFWRWPLFFTAINGREPLFVYLVHIAQGFWGSSTWAVRVVAAVSGALLTPAMIWFAWELAPDLKVNYRKQFALWSGLAVLALLWSQTISRLGQRMSLFVLLEILFFAALWRAWRTSSQRWWAIAGALAGLAFYTYISVRVVPLLMGLLLAYAFFFRRAELRSRWTGMAIGLAAALIVAAPLLVYFARSPGDFTMRTSQVDIIGRGGVPLLLDNARRVLGMAFLQGDGNDRLNYPGRPVLNAFTLAPFLLGLIYGLRRFWRPAHFFLLAGLGCLLLPTLLSSTDVGPDAPNFGRASGALPFFVLFIPLGLDQMLAWVSRWRLGLQIPASVAAWGLLLTSVAFTAHVYFVEYARYPNLFDTWEAGYTAVARDIASSPSAIAGGPAIIYADTEIADHPSVSYLLKDASIDMQPHSIDAKARCVRTLPDEPARYYIKADADPAALALVKSYLPDSRNDTPVADFAGRPWAYIIEQPAGGRVQFPELQPSTQAFQDGIELMGYWASQSTMRPGDRLYLRLFWRATVRPTQSYTVFVHLGNAGQVAAGSDDLPGHGACRTSDWRAGEVIVHEVQVEAPADMPEGVYDLTVGLYRLETMQRLAVAGSNDDQVNLGSVRVADHQ